MPVLEWNGLGLIDVPENADMGKVAEAAKRFVRTTKTSPSPQPMTSAQMNVQPVQPATPLAAAVPTIQTAIPQDAGLRAQSETDKLRQYRDTIGRMIAPLVGVNFDEMAGDQAKGILRAMVAYHGSPHTFDQFDASKIGTGEGSQMFGHGLYFAEKPEVAGGYQQSLTATPKLELPTAPPMPDVSGKFAIGLKSDIQQIMKLAADNPQSPQINWLKDNIAKRMSFWESKGRLQASDVGSSAVKDMDSLANWYSNHLEPHVDDLQSFLKRDPGSFYHVTIPDEHVAAMLDWDKSLSQQPNLLSSLNSIPNVERWWSKPGAIDITGQNLYKTLTHDLGGQPEASKALQDAGIPGIKYLDQGSRPASSTIIDQQLQQFLTKFNGDAQAAVNEYMRYIHDTPKAKERIAADLLRSLTKPQTRNFVVFDPSILQDVKRQ